MGELKPQVECGMEPRDDSDVSDVLATMREALLDGAPSLFRYAPTLTPAR